jgi:FAD/FMN-containing dehydrogenase
VALALRVAARYGLDVAVRGGGHNVAGNGSIEGGLMLNLRRMRDIAIDPATRVVRVGPGATLADVDAATQAHGLAVPVGVISGTGVAGLTLGGGVGWLTRAYGLAADNLLAADVVLADGSLVRAAADADAELLWGLRGGGGNFGVVTALEMQAYALGPEVFAGAFIYEQPRWTEALRAWAAWTPGLPDELTSIISFITPPASWGLPDRSMLLLGFAWAGPEAAEGERVVAPLRAAAPPDIEALEPVRWVDWQSSVDEVFPTGVRAYWKNVALDALDEGEIAAIVDAAARLPHTRTGFDIHHMEGAFGRVPVEATAFPNRSARYWINAYATWEGAELDGSAVAWARGVHAALQPFAAAGEYVNFLGADGSGADGRAAALQAYGPETLRRLVALKRRVDPENRFRRNHNVAPDLDV